MSADEQLEVIWWALASARFWVSVNADGSMVLQENATDSQGHLIGRTLHQFRGTRLEVAEQLVALRVGDRLDGIEHDLLKVSSGRSPIEDQFTLG